MAGTPFYFGDSQRKLYGVYHAPQAYRADAPAALLCNPFGAEAVRAFNVFKQLAMRLTREGSHVLRFDYYGSGDSAGECEELTLNGMINDAMIAQDELEAMSAARRFVWIGAGLGAAAAMQAAQKMKLRLDGLFLWDPVLSGASYLDALREAHIATLASVLDAPRARIERQTPQTGAELEEACGFALSPEMRDQLSGLSGAANSVRSKKVHLIGDNAADQAARLGLDESKVGVLNCDAALWNSDAAMNAHHVPSEVLAYVSNAIAGRA